VGGFILCITIIGIPFRIQKIKLAVFALAPFGSKAIDSENTGGCPVVLFNILWFLSGGVRIVLTHHILALLFKVTFIRIPFLIHHVKRDIRE
jgi:uncharacterized membrane protein YccF (DUF307 family)